MKNRIRQFLLLALAMTALGFSGCLDHDVDDTEIPWTRPHSWEDNAPGLGGGIGHGGGGF